MRRRVVGILHNEEPDVQQPLKKPQAEITLDSPIEALSLSGRARNALREAGCDTVRSLLENDFSKAVRRLGPVSREEIIASLTNHGFGMPPKLAEARSQRISELKDELSKLRENIDVTSRQWRARVERLEHRIHKLSSEPRSA